MRFLYNPKRYKEHLGIPSIKKDLNKKTIWFHTSSIGEALSILPIIEIYLKNKKTYQILITTMTKTSAYIMQKRLPEGCIHQYIPLDQFICVNRFLNHWKPEKFFMVESDIWPNIIVECFRRQIPITILNARISQKSYKKWLCIATLSKKLFSKFSVVLAQSEEDKNRYETLGAKNVFIMPNLKYAATPLPVNERELNILSSDIASRPCFVAISTHQGEEELFVKAHTLLKKNFPNILTILIPRHGNRIDKLKQDLHLQFPNLIFNRRTMNKQINKETDVYIVDTMGEVGLFCKLSPIAILGGTFVDIGGHNPLEPLMLGCHLIIGPYRQNIITLIDELKNDVILAENSEQLHDILKKEFLESANRQKTINTIDEQKLQLKNILKQYVFDEC
jgi:3-deoxy-D-manno-octulosonic-acid transferase